MTETILNLHGLKCPLPALRTRKALRQARPGAVFVVICNDPMAAIDIPNLLRETGDMLDMQSRDGDVLTFRITRRTS